MHRLSILFILLAGCARAQFQTTTPAGPSMVNKTVLLKLVNDIRKKGCQCGSSWYAAAPPLSWNDQLEAAAAEHSRDMLQNKYFGHTAPDGSNAGMRIEKVGYHWKTYGENIGQGYKSEEEVVNGWLNSPGHCKNIMSREFKEMAVARSGTLWTQVFGTR